MQNISIRSGKHTQLLSWASAGPSRPYTGSCGGTGSGCGHDGGPCRCTALLPSSAPGSGSGCCCCCSVRSSPPPSCSGPPLSPPYRPPPSAPQLPEESSRSAGRPAWPSPRRAAQRRGEAERRRAWPWGQLEGREETHKELINFQCRTDSWTWDTDETWQRWTLLWMSCVHDTVIRQRRGGDTWMKLGFNKSNKTVQVDVNLTFTIIHLLLWHSINL